MPKNLALSFQEHLGTHRVKQPAGVLPQQADIIDPSLPINRSEVLIAVEYLNIDSASFHQFMDSSDQDPQEAGRRIHKVIKQRGKLQNPVTGSGGMLVGTVKEIGDAVDNPELKALQPGDRIATLVSLTLTPLHLTKIKAVHPNIERVDVEGHAILFNSGVAAKLPGDINPGVALAALDVCGAPAKTAEIVSPGMNVVVIGGGGKSGLMCLYNAKKRVGPNGRVVAFEFSPNACAHLEKLSFVDEVVQGDARNAVEASQAIRRALGDKGADLCINVANTAGTEMSAILSVKDRGTVYFFSMATKFTAAALGAEGIGADLNLMIGNGFTRGHAEHTLQLLRDSEELRAFFASQYEA